jgi:antitoxin component of MazEF toxin-antitoxin module
MGMNDLDAPKGRNHFQVMTMIAILKKWGKGIALVLPDIIVKEGRLATGNQVEVNLSGQSIKIRKTAASSEIEKMCEAITPRNLHAETPWGEPQGREVW